jgi:hypothetical protein
MSQQRMERTAGGIANAVRRGMKCGFTLERLGSHAFSRPSMPGKNHQRWLFSST